MKRTEIEEGLGELADIAERDHEVQMARAQLYKSAKYSIKLHEMLKNVSEADGLEGWVQSKITKASEMLGSVYHHLDYENSPMSEHHDKPEEHEEVKEVTYKEKLHSKLEGMKKFKSAAHRKAVHAGKASGKRKK